LRKLPPLGSGAPLIPLVGAGGSIAGRQFILLRSTAERWGMLMSTAEQLFKSAAFMLTLIDAIVPIAAKHTYTFVSDDWYQEWLRSDEFSIKRSNQIVTMELIEKAHLASITALMRAKRWADAICLAYEKENFLSWCASVRGLLESGGDTVDSLLNIPLTFALRHRDIARSLAGNEERGMVVWEETERQLDHFVHAKWMRTKRKEENALKAKDNVDYVGALDQAIPNIKPLYHRLCSVCHPSSASIEYFYDVGAVPSLRLSPAKDKEAILGMCREFPDALFQAIQANCTPPFLILVVLHKFRAHPQLKALRLVDWKKLTMGAEVMEALKG
jgi:hypothetical protein